MTVEYRIVDNDRDDDYPGMVCIETWQDGALVARSWDEASVDPAIRLNVDYPTAVDDRTTTKETEVAYRVPTVAEAAKIGMTPELHKVMATYAAVIESVPLANAAEAVALPEAELVDEAKAWAEYAEAVK